MLALQQVKLLSRTWEDAHDALVDGDTRRIKLARGNLRMVIYESDDGAIDWDDNCLGRGQRRKDTLNEMWDEYAAICNENGESFCGGSSDVLRCKITQR